MGAVICIAVDAAAAAHERRTARAALGNDRYFGVPECDARYMLIASKDGDRARLRKALTQLNPLEARDGYDDTPLHHAAVRGHCECCKLLIRAEPTLVHAVNRGKNTALRLSACF